MEHITLIQKIFLVLLLFVVLEAIYEGLYDRGKSDKAWIVGNINLSIILSKFFQLLFFINIFLFAKHCAELGRFYYRFIFMWIAARVAVFNYINMLAAGRKNILGTTSVIDRVLAKMTERVWWMYVLFTIGGAAYFYYSFIGYL